jgi:hypothetical protein
MNVLDKKPPPDDPWWTEKGSIQVAMDYKWCRNPSNVTVWRHAPPGRPVASALFESAGRKTSFSTKKRRR